MIFHIEGQGKDWVCSQYVWGMEKSSHQKHMTMWAEIDILGYNLQSKSQMVAKANQYKMHIKCSYGHILQEVIQRLNTKYV